MCRPDSGTAEARKTTPRLRGLRRTALEDIVLTFGFALLIASPVLATWIFFDTIAERDFGIFMLSAHSWLAGGTAYPLTPLGANLSTPVGMFAFLPLAALPLRLAGSLWLGFGLAAAWVTWRLIRRELGLALDSGSQACLIAISLGSNPAWQILKEGQIGWFLWLGFTAAWILARHGSARVGGVTVGVLVMVKPQLGLLLVYFVVCRRWAAVRAAVVVMTALFILSICVFGVDSWITWARMAGVADTAHPFNMSLLGTATRSFGVSRIRTVGWLITVVAVLAATAKTLGRRADVDGDWTLATTAALLVSPLSWPYYTGLLVGPTLGWLQARRWRLGPVALASAVPFVPNVSYDCSSAVAQFTVGSLAGWALLALWGVTLMSRSSPDTLMESH